MRVLLVRLSALGDVVHTWPLAEAVRAARPEAHITWVVEAPLAPLVAGHPAVDAVVTTATRSWRRRPLSARTRAEAAVLRSRLQEIQPEVALDPQGTVKSALVCRSSGAPRRVGLARPWRRERLAGLAYTQTVDGCASDRHVVATNLELVRAVGGEPPPAPVAPDGRWLLDRGGATVPAGPWGASYAVLLPGAGRPDKVLSVDTLAAVARRLAGAGLAAVVAWGPGERERAAAVVVAADTGSHLAPATGLLELAALLAGARVVVGGDTGPVHLAASLGAPTLGVFLTTDPERNRPLGPRVAVVSGARPGSGPAGSATTGSARPVTQAEVLAALDGLLGRPA